MLLKKILNQFANEIFLRFTNFEKKLKRPNKLECASVSFLKKAARIQFSFGFPVDQKEETHYQNFFGLLMDSKRKKKRKKERKKDKCFGWKTSRDRVLFVFIFDVCIYLLPISMSENVKAKIHSLFAITDFAYALHLFCKPCIFTYALHISVSLAYLCKPCIFL